MDSISNLWGQITMDNIDQVIQKIEQQCRAEISAQLQGQFRQHYQKLAEQLQKQAEQEFQQAMQVLKQESQKLLQEKKEQLQKQIEIQEKNAQQRQNNQLMKLHQKFIESRFQSDILNHPKIKELQQELQYEIYKELEQKHEMKKQRDIKQILLHTQNQQMKYRKTLDKQIKQAIYATNGLQDLKKQINALRIGLGSMKSQYNLKIRKIDQNIKETQKKCKDIQKLGDVEEWRQKLQQMKIKIIEQQTQHRSEQIHNQNQNISLDKNKQEQNYNNYSQSQSQNQQLLTQEPKRMKRQNNNLHKINNYPSNQWLMESSVFANANNKKDIQFVQNDIGLNSDDSQDSLDHEDYNLQNKPFFQKRFPQIHDDLLQPPQRYTFNPQDYHEPNGQQKCRKPLLNFNVGELLRQKYQKDPLQKYLDKQNNQNSYNSSTRSNFGELYAQHLKNLNKGMNKKEQSKVNTKKSKLSEGAKKAIIKNLGSYCSNFY